MKAALLVFCIFLLIESYEFAKNDFPPAIFKDLYEKKPLKARKSVLAGPTLLSKSFPKIPIQEMKTKKHLYGAKYTVFSQAIRNQPLDLQSYYFPGELHEEPKLRVKKVLPDFWTGHDRRKRSPLGKTDDDKKNKSDDAIKTVSEVNEKNVTKTTNKTKAVKETKAKKYIKNDTIAINGTKVSSDLKSVARKPNKKPKSGKVKGEGEVLTRRSKNHKSHKRSSSKKGKSKSKKSDKRSSDKKSSKKGKEKNARRLIAAREAQIENYPYVVSIQKDGEHWCAGAILNQRLIITTANCVWKSNRMSRMQIRAGSRHLEHGGQLVNIAEVVKHPDWSIRKNPDADLALLLTDAFVKFSHSCHAVDLPNRMMMPTFEDAWVTSWGAERRDGIYIKQGLTLQAYYTRLIDREKCNNVTMRFGVMVTENFICLEQTGRRAPCTRDTGAPAVSDGVLWGLASWGIRKLCGTERFPAMFSYVASRKNMAFIINGTKYLMSEERQSPFLDRYTFSRTSHNNTFMSPN